MKHVPGPKAVAAQDSRTCSRAHPVELARAEGTVRRTNALEITMRDDWIQLAVKAQT